jgi:hypothetical protein
MQDTRKLPKIKGNFRGLNAKPTKVFFLLCPGVDRELRPAKLPMLRAAWGSGGWCRRCRR